MGLTIKQTVFEVLEPGEYPAVVAEIEAVDGQFGPQLRWRFDLGDGRRLSAWTSQTFSAKSKLGKWAVACFGGRELPRDYVLDTDKLLGRPVRLIVVTENGRDGPFSKVSDVLPPRRPQPAKPVAAEPPPPDWLDGETEEVPF